jgi:hypothetical protein
MAVVGIILGTIFNFAPVKALKHKAVMLACFAVISTLALYVTSQYFSYDLTAIYYFQAFASSLDGLLVTSLLGGYSPYVAAILLTIVFEISLIVSFALEAVVDGYFSKRKQKSTSKKLDLITPPSPETIQAQILNEKNLLEDEQNILELLRQGKIIQITPSINASQPDGYSFDGVIQEWDTKWARHVLDSLVHKGYLKAELVDKVVTCTACGSANVRVKKICPECNSLWLQKEALIEHISCGAIENRAAFDSASGELICPKCNVKLQRAGSDYRILPPSYRCSSCNMRSSSPLLVAKCENCGTTAELDEEPEIELYNYTAK